MRYLFAIICLLMVSCAGHKEIRPGSKEFYQLKTGDIIWVHTGTLAREKVMFINYEGDSLIARPYSFCVDSITRIQKEYTSGANTSIVVGGASVAATVLVITALAALFTFYLNLSTLF